jgi:hypothetical protein
MYISPLPFLLTLIKREVSTHPILRKPVTNTKAVMPKCLIPQFSLSCYVPRTPVKIIILKYAKRNARLQAPNLISFMLAGLAPASKIDPPLFAFARTNR